MLFFSVSLNGMEFPFEIIDVDGESHVGLIDALDSNLIQITSDSGNLTFSPRRVEIVQSLANNPFLLSKLTEDSKSMNSLYTLPQNQAERGNIIINGNAMFMNEFGVVSPINSNNQRRKTTKRQQSALLQKLQNAENYKNNENPQNITKIPQFPKSVTVIDLIDGSRLIATNFIIKEQKAICILLDHNYIPPAKIDVNKTKNKVDNKNERKEQEKIETANNKKIESELLIPIDKIYSVRFEVKNFSDIAEPAPDWLKYVNDSKSSGDRIVINKSGAFDVYSGIVIEVTNESVIFSIDGEKLPIQRTKIFGMILHSPDREEIKKKVVYGSQITLWTGTQIMLNSFTLKKIETGSSTENNRNDKVDDKNIISEVQVKKGGKQPVQSKILWTALAGFSGETLLEEVDNIIFSRGNSFYFNDVVPIIRERLVPFEWSSGEINKPQNISPIAKLKLFQTSRFGLNKNAGTKVDPSLESAAIPIVLNKNQAVNQPIPAIKNVILNGISYRHGLILSPKTTLEYIINGEEKVYSAIRGFVGIDDRLKPNGRAKLTIHIDEKLICATEICGTDPTKLLRYELPDTYKKIIITVDFADNITESSPISIGDLKLIK
jgi:hypothetical protein